MKTKVVSILERSKKAFNHQNHEEKSAGFLREESVCVFLLLIIGLFLMFHAQYSFCQSDETFYISTVKKIYQGQRLILDEWHPTQFYSPLLLPFYAIHRFVVGGDEGIIHYYRIIMILFSIMSSLLLFNEVKKTHNCLNAFVSSAFLMLFSRANIAGVSYYNLHLHFTILALLMWRRTQNYPDPVCIVYSALCGLLISFCVLCQPYSVFSVVLFLLVLLFDEKSRKNARIVITTIIIAGVSYIILFLTKGTVSSYLTNLRYILNDPQHLTGIASSLVLSIKSYNQILSIVCCVLSLVVSVWFLITRMQGKQLTSRQIMCQILLLVISVLKPIINVSIIPCYSFFAAITVATLPTFLYYVSRQNTIEQQLYILGFFSAMTWAVGSNTRADTMMVGFVVSGVGGLLYMDKLTNEIVHFDLLNVCRVLFRAVSISRA